MADELRFVRDRLQRAQENLDDLKRLLATYFASDFYRLTVECEPGAGGAGTFRITENEVRGPEPRAMTLVGDIVHELRSSLDHLAWQLVKQNGGKPDHLTDFPILTVSPTPNRHGRVKHPVPRGAVMEEAATLIAESQPYRTFRIGSTIHTPRSARRRSSFWSCCSQRLPSHGPSAWA